MIRPVRSNVTAHALRTDAPRARRVAAVLRSRTGTALASRRAMTSMDDVKDFLAHRRIAFVGVSHDPTDFSRAVWNAMKERDYDLVPVNPNAEEIDGRPAVDRLSDIDAPVDGVLIMTPAAASADVVREAIDLGIPRVWLHRGAGKGAVSDEAVALAGEAGVHVVDGQCPMMFLEDHGFGHELHAFFKKVGGSYPK